MRACVCAQELEPRGQATEGFAGGRKQAGERERARKREPISWESVQTKAAADAASTKNAVTASHLEAVTGKRVHEQQSDSRWTEISRDVASCRETKAGAEDDLSRRQLTLDSP